MRMFYLYRIEDETGVSGAGIVAEGCQFSDGQCCMTWLTGLTSVAVYKDLKTLEGIHGHKGKTRVVYEDSDQVDKKTGEVFISDHVSLFRMKPDGTEEFMGSGEAGRYCKISEWLKWQKFIKEHPEVRTRHPTMP